MRESTLEMTDVLAAIVRGDAVGCADLAAIDPREFCRGAVHHGLLPLVAERLAGRADVPPALASILRERANQAIAIDLLCESELKTLLSELSRAGVAALLIKGGQLAYSHYPRPDLRPRIDTDILIPRHACSTVDDLLPRLGYVRRGGMSGELVAYQATYVKRREETLVHAVDVHWKVANPQVFASVLSYEELADKAVMLPRFGSSARGLSNVHALFLACVHRVAHHYDSDHLIWLYDIDLVARRLTEAGWGWFVELAAERRVASVCRRSLERAVASFETPVPSDLWNNLRSSEAVGGEISAGYLEPRCVIGAIVDELRALTSWSDRRRLLREHLFPPADYMRRVYAPSSGAPLPVLHARRFWRGARKWLARA